MKQNWFLYDGTLMRKVEKEILAEDLRARKEACKVVHNAIKAKAKAIKVTGNLAKGVYTKHLKYKSYVGIHAPGFQNYLLEFGTRKMKKRPIVYPTFDECSEEVGRILGGYHL